MKRNNKTSGALEMIKSQKEHDKKKIICFNCKKHESSSPNLMCKKCSDRSLRKIEKLKKQIKDKRAKKKDKYCEYCNKEIKTKIDLKSYIDDGYCKPCAVKHKKWADEIFGL